MTSPAKPDLDAYGAGVVVLTSVVGPGLAPLVSAYFLILLGWGAGALAGLYMREEPARRPAVYLAVTFVLSVGTSGGLASLVADQLPVGTVAAHALLLPISAALAAFPDRLLDVAREGWDRLAGLARRGNDDTQRGGK